MTPLGNKVFISPDAEREEKKTAGGLVIVGKEEVFKYGTVVSVSEDIPDPRIKPGDKVAYGAGAGIEVGEHLIMDYTALAFIVG